MLATAQPTNNEKHNKLVGKDERLESVVAQNEEYNAKPSEKKLYTAIPT